MIRGKANYDFKPMKWKRRFLPKSGILSDAVGYMAGQLDYGEVSVKDLKNQILGQREQKEVCFLLMCLLSAR